MKYTYKEARKEMDFYVEKLKQTFPEEAYKIQCSWESFVEGMEFQYDKGYEDGYNIRTREWKNVSPN